MKIRVTCPKCKESNIEEIAQISDDPIQIACRNCQTSIRFRPANNASPINAAPVTLSQPTESLELVCDGCQSRLKAPKSAVGKSIRCPKCKTVKQIAESPAINTSPRASNTMSTSMAVSISTPATPAPQPQRQIQPQPQTQPQTHSILETPFEQSVIPTQAIDKNKNEEWLSELPLPDTTQPSSHGSFANYANVSSTSSKPTTFWDRIDAWLNRNRPPLCWKEPWNFRNALREDQGMRILASLAIAFCAAGLYSAAHIPFPGPLNFDFWKFFFGLAILSGGSGYLALTGEKTIRFIRAEIIATNESLKTCRTVENFYLGDKHYYKEYAWASMHQVYVASGANLGMTFSIIIIPTKSGQGGQEIFGIPKRINLMELVAFIESRGVRVIELMEAPARYRKRVKAAFVIPFAAFLLAVGIASLIAFAFLRQAEAPKKQFRDFDIFMGPERFEPSPAVRKEIERQQENLERMRRGLPPILPTKPL